MVSHLNKEKFKQTEKEFDKIYNFLTNELICHIPSDAAISKEWFKRVLDYNVPYGKKNRGLSTVFSYQCLANGNENDEDLKIASILGWCIELLQAFFLITDDIMDSSLTRRGQPCWYSLKDVGLNAVNDSLYVENSIYEVLRRHLRHKPYYIDIIDLFHESTMKTIIGQNLDMCTSTNEVNFTNFTLERYNSIVKYKTAHYSFHLPIASALYMTGVTDVGVHDYSKNILLKMGEYFQIQDDYLDCFGDPEVTGKIGTDIEENKCSWLIVRALLRCSGDQKLKLEENYGQKDILKTSEVKKIYEELGLREVFKKYEEESYQELVTLIEGIPPTLPKEMFHIALAKIYKRYK